MKRIWLALLFGLASLALASSAAMARSIKVMILDGASAAAYHNWKLTTAVMKRELEEAGLFDVTVVTLPPADGDFSNVHPDFEKYQVVVSNYDSQDWPAALKAAFEAYMKNGGGAGVGAWRRQRLSRLGGVQRDDRAGRLAQARRPRRALLVLRQRQAGVRPHAGSRRHAWQAQALPYHGARPRSTRS